MPEVFRENFWGQKCSAIGKRLGTTALDHGSRLIEQTCVSAYIFIKTISPYLIRHYLIAIYVSEIIFHYTPKSKGQILIEFLFLFCSVDKI